MSTKKVRTSPAFDVAIVPGGWGSAWHYKKLLEILHQFGLRAYVVNRHQDNPSARLVIAHSVGTLEPWEEIVKEHAILLGPIFIQNLPSMKEIRHRVARSRVQELVYQLVHNKIFSGLSLLGKSMLYLLRDPGLMKHQSRLLLRNNFSEKISNFQKKSPLTAIHIVAYDNDVWTDKAFNQIAKGWKGVKVHTRTAPHDDIFYGYRHYAQWIKELLK